MELKKKIKCQHCFIIIEENGQCDCKKVNMIQGIITEGKLGIDYIDISARLLNE